MTSALTATGSTRAWRRLRQLMANQLEQQGSIPCWRCGRPITPDMPWNLGHVHDRALGGDDTDLAPEHRACSDRSGGQLGARLRTKRHGHNNGRAGNGPTPSRDW